MIHFGQIRKISSFNGVQSRVFETLLSQGTLTKKDLLDFYSGEDIKDKYRLIEKEINSLLEF